MKAVLKREPQEISNRAGLMIIHRKIADNWIPSRTLWTIAFLTTQSTAKTNEAPKRHWSDILLNLVSSGKIRNFRDLVNPSRQMKHERSFESTKQNTGRWCRLDRGLRYGKPTDQGRNASVSLTQSSKKQSLTDPRNWEADPQRASLWSHAIERLTASLETQPTARNEYAFRAQFWHGWYERTDTRSAAGRARSKYVAWKNSEEWYQMQIMTRKCCCGRFWSYPSGPKSIFLLWYLLCPKAESTSQSDSSYQQHSIWIKRLCCHGKEATLRI